MAFTLLFRVFVMDDLAYFDGGIFTWLHGGGPLYCVWPLFLFFCGELNLLVFKLTGTVAVLVN